MVKLGGGRKAVDDNSDMPPRGKLKGSPIISLLRTDRSFIGCWRGKCGCGGRKLGWPANAALLSDTSTELSLLWDSGELMLGELEFL